MNRLFERSPAPTLPRSFHRETPILDTALQRSHRLGFRPDQVVTQIHCMKGRFGQAGSPTCTQLPNALQSPLMRSPQRCIGATRRLRTPVQKSFSSRSAGDPTESPPLLVRWGTNPATSSLNNPTMASLSAGLTKTEASGSQMIERQRTVILHRTWSAIITTNRCGANLE